MTLNNYFCILIVQTCKFESHDFNFKKLLIVDVFQSEEKVL